MKSCILPFDIDVEMKAYHSKAFPLGIAKANIADYELWLCGKSIIGIYSPNEGTQLFDVYDDDLWSERDGFISTQKLSLEPSSTYQCNFDLIANNKKMIEEGHYISGWFNEFFIPQKAVYGRSDYDHDYLIFGYDDITGAFLSAGYLASGQYDFFSIPYDNYLRGIYENREQEIFVNYHKINKEFSPMFDIRLIKDRIQDHLYSKNPCQTCFREAEYGINAWNKLALYISEHKNNTLDIRYCRLFMEHRYLMLKRIQTLNKLGFVVGRRLYDDYNDKVYKRSRIVHTLFLKYNLSQKPDILQKLEKMIVEINDCEMHLLNEVTNQIVI